MMAEYMIKKRMKKRQRNDFADSDQFDEDIVINGDDLSKIGKKHILGFMILAMVMVCCFNRRKSGRHNIILVKEEGAGERVKEIHDTETSSKKKKSKKK